MLEDGTVFRRVVLEELNSSLFPFSRNFDLFNFFSCIFIVNTNCNGYDARLFLVLEANRIVSKYFVYLLSRAL